MAKMKLDRRQMMRQAVVATSALVFGTKFSTLSLAATEQTTFSGFDGQSIVWGGVGYLPTDKAAIPNILPVIQMKTANGGQLLNQLLGKELFNNLKTESAFCQKVNDANLCWGKTDNDGEANFGMILGIAAEQTIQDSRDETASFTFLRLISYNFIFQVTASGGVQIIACYPVGGRLDSIKYGQDNTPLKDYYLAMFSRASTSGETIPQQYRRLFETRPFGKIKTGLNFRVSSVSLKPAVSEYLEKENVNPEHFSEWLGTAATVSLGDNVNVSVLPYKLSDATFAMAESFSEKQELFFGIPDGDLAVEPSLLLIKIILKDHPRDNTKFLQKLAVFLLVKISRVVNGQKTLLFKQVIFGEQFQVIFKKKEWRQADSTTVFKLTEDSLNMLFSAITKPDVRKKLVDGVKVEAESSERNAEIGQYKRIKLRPETAPNLEAECEAVKKYT
jgi:hypothetical protein